MSAAARGGGWEEVGEMRRTQVRKWGMPMRCKMQMNRGARPSEPRPKFSRTAYGQYKKKNQGRRTVGNCNLGKIW